MRSAVLVMIFVLLGAFDLLAAEPASIRWHEKMPQTEQLQSKSMLLYFTTTGCSYYTKMKKSTLAQQDVVQRIEKNFVAVKLDGRKHAEIAKRLKVRYYPTTAIVHPSGAVVDIIPGYVQPKAFLHRLANAQKKLDYQTKLLAAKNRNTELK